ncbi:MAG TPA: BadF/BadG/BcrA/BcrD ATPase family protein [Pseudolysinimonas sp.]|nr:BadF/BadG/BcrA/BcrD ATPase family protein [Pseudolysinimonas sp.]
MVDAGVDGGQSQVRLAIAGRPEVHAVDGVAHSDGDTVALLVDRIAEAWAAARQDDDELGRLVLGLTTMPADDGTAERLADRIAGATGAREVWLTGDAVTAHAGALPAGDGVVMVVGTGIACLAIDARTGATRRVDGDGFLLGDAGASFWIGSRGIEAALRAFDGRGGATALSGAVEERFGSLDLLPGRLHAQERAVNAIAQFAAVVQDQARAGDAVAGAILADAADEVVTSIRAAAGVIEHSPVPVALAGRAVAAGTPLRDLIDERLALEPRLIPVAAAGSPLDGACAIARDGDRPGYETLIRTRRSA